MLLPPKAYCCEAIVFCTVALSPFGLKAAYVLLEPNFLPYFMMCNINPQIFTQYVGSISVITSSVRREI